MNTDADAEQSNCFKSGDIPRAESCGNMFIHLARELVPLGGCEAKTRQF